MPHLTLHLRVLPSDGAATAWHAEARMEGEPAQCGHLPVGPTELAHRVAGVVGAPLSVASTSARVAAVDQCLAAADDGQQWYSETRKADPLGAARALLSVLDDLVSMGWQGTPLVGTPQLAVVSWLADQGVPPGLPQEVARLAKAVDERAPAVSLALRLSSPRAHFDAVTRRLFCALEAQGAAVVEPTALAPAAPADTDLGRLQRALLGQGSRPCLEGDGTLRILEGDGPWEAAALATALCPDEGVWLLSSEAHILDRARGQQDRPLFGQASASAFRPALQVLPLVLALQTSPQDPQAALDLLSLPVSPVPRRIAKDLVGALSRQPAVGSPQWRDTLEVSLARHLERYPDTHAERLRARLERFFPEAPPAALTAGHACSLSEAVAQWLRGRGAHDDDAVLLHASTVATELAQTLAQLPADHVLEPLELARLHTLAVGEGVVLESVAEAGAPASATAPDAVPLGVGRLTWFGVVAGAAEAARPRAWTATETDALQAAGVELPSPGAVRAHEQDAWVRAVLAPTDQLTVVRWASSGGKHVDPHAFFDLWETCLADGALRQVTTSGSKLRAQGRHAALEAVAAAASVVPTADWSVPAGSVSTSRAWSATSLETLLNCPLQWTLHYAAKVRPGDTAALPDLRTLSGTFGHSLFEQFLFSPSMDWDRLTPEAARAGLAALFDTRVALEAAPLTLPEHTGAARRLRGQLSEAAARLVSVLKAGSWRPAAPEKPLEDFKTRFDGEVLSGSIDLLLVDDQGNPGIVDLKLGGTRYRREILADGVAVQLALYAYAAAGGTPPLPPVAFFILEDGEMLTTDASAFPGATVVQGSSPGETWLNTERAWSWQSAAVRAGAVSARGKHVASPAPESTGAQVGRPPPDGPFLGKAASCRYCKAQRLCTFSRDGAEA